MQILKEVKLLIIPRENFPINPNNTDFITKNFGKYEISHLKIPKISSSMIRENHDYDGVPKSLISTIRVNNLYNQSNIDT